MNLDNTPPHKMNEFEAASVEKTITEHGAFGEQEPSLHLDKEDQIPEGNRI